MHTWTAVEPDGWIADCEIREVMALLPTRVAGRWAWPGMRYFAVFVHYPPVGQPDGPLRWVGRDYGAWQRRARAWTAEALR